jgi:Mg/Co/Ni transporter MgtE
MAKRALVKGTLWGAGLAGGATLLLGTILTITIEGPLPNQVGLALFMAFLAATVGGLVGPMFARRREDAGDPTGEEVEAGRRDRNPR